MKTKICVVGAGIIGVTSALNILEEFGTSISLTIVADSFSPFLTTDIAAGWWEPYCLEETPKHLIKQWSTETFDYFNKIISSGVGAECGVFYQGAFFLSLKPMDTPDWVDVVYDFRELTKREMERFPYHTHGFYLTSIIAEGSKFVPFIMKKVITKGGRILQRKLENLNELGDEFDVIINCSGLGAKYLVPDDKIYPNRGQVMRVHAPQVKFSYIDVASGGYILPNSDWVILGGTDQPGNEDKSLSASDREKILTDCAKLFPGVEKSQVLGEFVGQRPARPSVRMEKEIRKISGKYVAVIHNYGHGGAGITLSWGCANNVTRILTEVLQQA